MNVPKSSRPARPLEGKKAPRTLIGKLRQRGIFGTLTAFLGSGWLAYEIVHFIFVEHYHLPDWLKDITILIVVCSTLSVTTWRWFRGEKHRRTRWELIFVPAFVVAAAAAGIITILKSEPGEAVAGPAPEIAWSNSVAVLPFLDMSPGKDQEYFCDGLTEEMINELSQIGTLKVAARTSAFAFKDQGRDIREIGRKLGVENVLEGSVRKDGARLRITVQLISVADGFHIWSRNYDRDFGGVFAIQDNIARAVAGALRISLLELAPPRPRTANLDAYEEYLQGRYDYSTPTREGLARAVGHFERAVALDPGFARAWAALGGSIAFQASVGHVPVSGNVERASAAIDRALALDGRLASAYLFRGWIKMSFDWDWKAADEAYAKALEIDPGSGLVAASQLALGLGRFDRAEALARRAAEVDALNASAVMNLALTVFYAGRLEEARPLFEEVLRLDPNRGNVHALLAQILLLQSRPAEALALLDQETEPLFGLPARAMALQALDRSGEFRDELAKYIERYRTGNAYQVAQTYAFAGETDEAFRWLETAYEQRDGGLFLVKADPLFAKLRADGRFSSFLKKLGIPPGRP
jgi:TolB-like protein/Tfp pilus assembly protein PilF